MLTPLAVGPGQPFPYISGLSQSLAVRVRDSENGEERSARVKVPEGLTRFVAVGSEPRLIPQEQVIAHFLPWLFPGMEVLEHAYFRVTRDADFELSDEADDLLEAVETELRRRRFGDVVRLEVSSGASNTMLTWLKQGLAVTDLQVYPTSGLVDMADVSQLADINRPDLKFEPWIPLTRARLSSSPGRASRSVFPDSQRRRCWCSCPTTRSPRVSRRSSGPAPRTPTWSRSRRRCIAPPTTRP